MGRLPEDLLADKARTASQQDPYLCLTALLGGLVGTGRFGAQALEGGIDLFLGVRCALEAEVVLALLETEEALPERVRVLAHHLGDAIGKLAPPFPHLAHLVARELFVLGLPHHPAHVAPGLEVHHVVVAVLAHQQALRSDRLVDHLTGFETDLFDVPTRIRVHVRPGRRMLVAHARSFDQR